MSSNGLPVSYGYPAHVPLMHYPSPMYGNPYHPGPFSPLVEGHPPPPNSHDGQFSRSGNGDDHQQLLQKVSSVLPDINRLLNEYRDTHGQLSAKELLSRQTQLEHEEALNKAKIELEAVKKEFEKVIQSLVSDNHKLEREAVQLRADNSKLEREVVDSGKELAKLEKVSSECRSLRLEVGSLEDSRKDLADALDSIRQSQEDLMTTKIAQEKEIEVSKKDVQNEREMKHRMIEDMKQQHKDQLTTKEKDHSRAMAENKVTLSKVQLELAAMITKHSHQKKEVEAARGLQEELRVKCEAKCEATSKELADAIARHSTELERVKRQVSTW